MISGWYVLYSDGPRQRVREAADFTAAIRAASELNRDGRDVVQLGPLDHRRADEVMAADEIDRLCVEHALS